MVRKKKKEWMTYTENGKTFMICKVCQSEYIEVDNNKEWFVTAADILVGGKTFTVPVKRSKVDKFKTFKLK